MEQMQPRRNHGLVLLILGIGLVLIAVAAFLAIPKAQGAVAAANASAVPITVNFPAHDVRLTDLQGNPVAFSEHTGQVILYNAWATWCPPCKQEMPVLEAYYRAHKQDGFVVIAVEDGQPVSEVAEYAKNAGLTFPVWPDQKWVATTTFGISDLPTSYVIDRTFKVRLMWLGAISLDQLEQYVTPLLKGG